MSSYEVGSEFANEGRSEYEQPIIAQLFKVLPTMQHIDELLQWLSYTTVQYFHVEVAEFWALQVQNPFQYTSQLRMLVCKDNSVPHQIVASGQVAAIAERLLHERRSLKVQPISAVFATYQASLLSRYRLNYCASSFFSNSTLFLPVSNNFSSAGSPTPLTITIFLFMQQIVHQGLLRSIDLILEQAMQMAGNRGLLWRAGSGPSTISEPIMMQPPITPSFTPPPLSSFPTPVTPSPFGMPAPTPVPQPVPPRRQLLTLAELVPHRLTNVDLMRSSNPFADAVVIADKQARRLYGIIDGRKNVRTLAQEAGMDSKELQKALGKLLTEGRIELRDAQGQTVDNSQPLDF